MANMNHYADINGETVELVGNMFGMPVAEFAAKFPGVSGRRYDSFSMKVMKAADGRTLPITRVIEFKKFPSRHVCDDRCLNATGKVMKCECSCGGKNHGKGRYFTITREVQVAF
jgi:hypothetical protein